MPVKLVTIAAILFLTVALAPLAAADGVGASGQCYNEDATQGGEDRVAVGTDGVVLPSGTGVAAAIVKFATGDQVPGDNKAPCERYDCGDSVGTSCGTQRPRYDYLEVHAKVGGRTIQVCYFGNVQVFTSAFCPTTPTGAGGPR